MSDASNIIDENVISFITESREMIDEVEPHLIHLSQSAEPGGAADVETTNLIFRLFHSIKGTAGFLQFNEVVKITHEAETLLDLIRNGQVEMTRSNTDVLCRTCDIVNALLSQIEATGSDSGFETDGENIIAELSACINPDTPPPQESATAAQDSGPADTTPDTPDDGIHISLEPIETETPGDTDTQAAMEKSENLEQLLLTPEMIQRFVEEAVEQLEVVEESLLKLQESPDSDNTETIQEAFRSLHSFKGNCGFSGYADIEQLAHKTETIMELLKEGEITADPAIIQTLLHMVDVFNQAIADISKGGAGVIANRAVLLDLLDDTIPQDTSQAASAAAAEPAPPEQAAPAADTEPVQEAREPSQPQKPQIEQPEALYLLRDNAPLPQKQESGKSKSATTAAIPSASRVVARQDIRVNLIKLDQLINMVGELVIAETMVTRNPDLQGYEFENFEKSANHLKKIVRDIQDMTLSVRMIPVSGVFRKMIRLVHDLSAKANKKVNLKLSGEDTEIDKTVSELIADPLVHLVRNAIDHGLESPEERRKAGKSETGEVVLEAKHEGGEIWISIKDDGKGLSREKILKKAMDKGLLKDDGSHLEDKEVFNYIFHPGFSTADKITDVSGRGVGMDVVKKNIEKIKGHVDVRSQKGLGTVFVLRIPLTLAIIDGMLVRVGKTRYTIPLLSIRESIQVEKKQVTVTMDGQELLKVREELIPVLRLHELHNLDPDQKDLVGGLVVIVEHRDESAALLIDEILGEQQAVIKGLSNYVGNVTGLSGCTILGDGEISLILDIGGLVLKAQDKAA